MTVSRDTIFALSSGTLPAAIAVIRMSGPSAFAAAQSLLSTPLPQPRQAGLRKLRDPRSGELLDEALVLAFPAGRSETGEDMVELHCHGSHAVVRGVEAVLSQLPQVRRAEAGEFTRRAFLSGKMDLAGIEGLGDLLAAETEVQRRSAMAMMGGGLSRRIAEWTSRLRRISAIIEARLDFSDEGDVASDQTAAVDVNSLLGLLADEMAVELGRPSAERLRDGVRIAIGGPPNAGKSTLFNALVGREAAIVSPHAGTTRDVIEATVAFHGIPMVLADSAGLRDSGDEIERIGIERAEALLGTADVILWLGHPEEMPATEGGRVIQIAAKSDCLDEPNRGLPISAKTGEGIERLVELMCEAAKPLVPLAGEYALTRRQRQIVERTQSAVGEASGIADEVLLGELVRQALVSLDELTGRSTTEAVLDELFSGFCIGK